MTEKKNIKLETLKWCVNHSVEEIIEKLEFEEEKERVEKLSIN